MMTHRFIAAFLALVLASVACSTELGTPPAAVPTAAAATATSIAVPPLTLDQLKNAEIQITGISDDANGKTRTVQLVDGQYISGNDRSAVGYVSVSMGSQVAFGDLNGDGAPDAAMIIGENTGGSGDFVSVVAMLNQGGKAVFGGAVGIDDRPKINSLDIRDGEIVLDGMVHGPNDPGCCAAQPVTENFRLWSGRLALTHYTSKIPDGTERIIKIDTPSQGMVVSDPFTISGSITISPFENNLAYFVFQEGNPDPVAQSAIIISAPAPGGPGTFQLPLDFTQAGLKGNLRIEISDLSAADGAYLAMDTLFVTVK
jgi:hypothetical protein